MEKMVRRGGSYDGSFASRLSGAILIFTTKTKTTAQPRRFRIMRFELRRRKSSRNEATTVENKEYRCSRRLNRTKA
jgi:hypothetical protein